ncbi:hypothetical protein KA005_39820 [bacterium]|nr:hypothetical protein [bacterium]
MEKAEKMNNKTGLILFLLVVFMVAGSAAFAAEPKEIKQAGLKPKAFYKEMEEEFLLQIGPFTAEREVSGFHFPADRQTALKEQKMKVFYKGRPLANADVNILTESGWRKSLRTDSDGKVLITPIETSKKNESYFYAVTYKDPINGASYFSSMLMPVVKPQPEWMKKAGGFIFWTFTGSGLVVLYVVGAIYRKRKRDRKTMHEFNRYKIGRD